MIIFIHHIGRHIYIQKIDKISNNNANIKIR